MKRRIILSFGTAICGMLLILAGSVQADWRELGKVTASDGTAISYFGWSVSISGDYAIVGAYFDDSRGAAYVFIRDGNSWTQQAKLAASDGADFDYFGCSVSISGDYAIVGANYDDDNGRASGSAYIFKRDGTTWSEQAKLTASDGAADDYFGTSVSISGDYAIVGAYYDDDNGSNSGSAYIFKRDGTAWTEQLKLTASDGAAGDWFGTSVSISDDYVLIGASYDDDNVSDSGSAYIFKRDGTAWNQQVKLTASDANISDYLGCSVSISDESAIVGACGNDGHCGSAYIFKRDGEVWNQQAKLTASDGAVGDFFGYSVSISGDYVLIGAFYDDDKGSNSGSSYIFKRDGTIWGLQKKLTASDGAAEDYFGYSVSISGDYTLVGVPGDNDGGHDAGSAYLFGICPAADMTGDCFVDFKDFAVLANEWLTGYK